MGRNIGAAVLVGLLVAACGKESPLGDMQRIVPLYAGADVVDARSVADRRESIIQFDVEASQASEDDIIEFYRNTMTEKGWRLAEIERFPGDGSVFSMTKDDVGTLAIQTIIKKSEDTGKIRVVLNLTES